MYFLTSTDRFLDYEVIWPKPGSGPRAPVIKDLLSQVLTHRKELLAEWERKVCPK